MAGAKQAFMECGFDATGVNDICRIAGISKSTLYVYFDSKEDLFEALVEAERERLFQGIAEALTSHALPQDALATFGLKLAEIICSPEVIQAQRIMIGIAGRMPELGARFYSGGAMRAQKDLAKFLNQNVAMGRLTIPDPPLAAAQFIELCIAPLWKPRIFGKEALPPLRHDLENAVNSAVSMFLAAYGRPTTAA
jgi:TetR/AcrR family transcriptional regulator of autoinduction and epiphytic fitness